MSNTCKRLRIVDRVLRSLDQRAPVAELMTRFCHLMGDFGVGADSPWVCFFFSGEQTQSVTLHLSAEIPRFGIHKWAFRRIEFVFKKSVSWFD